MQQDFILKGIFFVKKILVFKIPTGNLNRKLYNEAQNRSN